MELATKTAIENRPITFVIVGGVIIYPVAILITILLIASGRHTSIFVLPFLSAFIVDGFHWFVARYERKSRIAQIIAIVPAGFFALLCIISGVKYYGKPYVLERPGDRFD